MKLNTIMAIILIVICVSFAAGMKVKLPYRTAPGVVMERKIIETYQVKTVQNSGKEQSEKIKTGEYYEFSYLQRGILYVVTCDYATYRMMLPGEVIPFRLPEGAIRKAIRNWKER